MKIYDILIRPQNCLDCDSTCDHHTNYQDLCRKGKSYNGQNKCFECWKNKFEVEPKFYRKVHCYAKTHRSETLHAQCGCGGERQVFIKKGNQRRQLLYRKENYLSVLGMVIHVFLQIEEIQRDTARTEHQSNKNDIGCIVLSVSVLSYCQKEAIAELTLLTSQLSHIYHVLYGHNFPRFSYFAAISLA